MRVVSVDSLGSCLHNTGERRVPTPRAQARPARLPLPAARRRATPAAGPRRRPPCCAISAHLPSSPPISQETAALLRYKFVLAVENSVCPDYVTEKVWLQPPPSDLA